MWLVLAAVAALVDALLLQSSNRWVVRRAWFALPAGRRFSPRWPPDARGAATYRAEPPPARSLPVLAMADRRFPGDDAALSSASDTSYVLRRKRSFFAGKYVPYFVRIEATLESDDVVLRAAHAVPLGPSLFFLAVAANAIASEGRTLFGLGVLVLAVAVLGVGHVIGGDRRERALERALDLLEAGMRAAISASESPVEAR